MSRVSHMCLTWGKLSRKHNFQLSQKSYVPEIICPMYQTSHSKRHKSHKSRKSLDMSVCHTSHKSHGKGRQMRRGRQVEMEGRIDGKEDEIE
jgi:hypothetical protein